MLKWILKVLFAIGFVLSSIVVGVMYSKLSFIDWPYLIGALVFLVATILVPVKNQTNL
jgi:hypothetical protein|tara:strand:+ start:752 stop:925 length:174 start_codon:yes stop_codon:yes gene_type:complete